MHEKILRLVSKYNYDYADVRLEKSINTSVKISDSEIDATSGSSQGISVRVLKNGSWGFVSSNIKKEGDVGGIEALLKKAERLAALTKGKVKLADLRLRSAAVKAKSKDPLEISIDEKIKKITDAAKHMNGRRKKRIKNKIISLADGFSEITFLNSEGIEVIQESNHVYLSCMAIAKKGALIQRGTETCGRVDSYKKIKFYECAESAAEKAERLLDADAPPAGRMTAVLDQEMTGVFSHEALGHASEADSVVQRESILRGRLGKKIGNELVNIIDDPTANDFGHYVFDNEGVKAKKTKLVENGVLRSYLNSRENCHLVGVEANGHARAEDYSNFPIVRMSNTSLIPGKTNTNEIFDIRDGIYLKGMKGGSVDIFSGAFMFKAEEAYEIKNGEIGRLFRDTTISGNILETLKNVEAVGKDFGTSPGFCGKFGQHVAVSDGGPHVRVGDVKIG